MSTQIGKENLSKNIFKLADNETGLDTDLPVLSGTLGPSVIDVRKLYAQTGHFTYDPGFTSTGSCSSAITYIDGEKGVLLHRGYPIEELARKHDFPTIAYLLIHGIMPEKNSLNDFKRAINGAEENVDIDQIVKKILKLYENTRS